MPVQYLGANNQGADTLALFKTQMQAEVLSAFETTNITESRHIVVPVNGAKSATFPCIGKVNASYHTPGTELTGMLASQSEVEIVIDGVLESDMFLDELDEIMTNIPYRTKYSQAMGAKLASELDKNVFQEIVLGANCAGTISDGAATPTYMNPGQQVLGDFHNANAATAATAWAAGVLEAAQKFAEANIDPNTPKYVAVKPADYYKMLNNTNIINRDFSGAGSYADGKIFKFAGFDILMSNNIPTTNITTGKHPVDASKVVGVFWIPDAVGTARASAVKIRTQEQLNKLGNLIVASVACGHRYLRPEGCGKFYVS